MSVRILTSHFDNRFPPHFSRKLNSVIDRRNNFVFVASEFYGDPSKIDRYFRSFLNMFTQVGITFPNACVVDGRISKEQAQKVLASADVIWLAGGDTVAQYRYFGEYELISILQSTDAVIIGMSAGAINMTSKAICSLASGHKTQAVYQALNLVNISVEPHFKPDKIPQELILLSKQYPIVGLCDNSAVIEENGRYELFGEIFWLENGTAKPITRL